MNKKGKQLKVVQPNVQELEGKPPHPDNGAIPKRVVVEGRNPSVKNISVSEMRTNHPRKDTVSDDNTKEDVSGLV